MTLVMLSFCSKQQDQQRQIKASSLVGLVGKNKYQLRWHHIPEDLNLL
jgi:hypothetical protein